MEILNTYFAEKTKNKIVLDLGFVGYSGQLNPRTKCIMKHSKKWYGGDIDKNFISQHKKELKNIFYCDLNTPSFTKNFPKDVEIITMVEVLEHLKYPLKTLESLCQYKNENTYLFVTVPNGMSFGRVLFGLLKEEILLKQDIEHVYLFNKQTLTNIFRTAGLKEFSIKPYVDNRRLKILLYLFPNFSSGFLVYGK